MKEKQLIIWQKIKKPKPWFQIVWVAVSAVVIAVTLVSLFVEGCPEIVEYVLYALAALGLAYSTYIVVRIIPKIKAWVITLLKKTEFTSNVLQDYGFRTTVFAVCTFIISVGYAVMEGVIALTSKSLWFGALAFYYFVLAFIRGALLTSKRKAIKLRGEGHEYPINVTKIYGATGISLIVLTLALSVEVFHMSVNSETFRYPGLAIFASAAYAFLKIIMSVYNFIKAKKFEDLTVGAIRNVNLADALVSILALQTALLTAFSSGAENLGLFNLLTGVVACALIVLVGITMINKSNKLLKRYKNER